MAVYQSGAKKGSPGGHGMSAGPRHRCNVWAISPYTLLYTRTANGTVSAYNAYVRPALARQLDVSGNEPPAGEGEPSYPSVFLNHGPYYGDESDVRYR